MGIYRHSLEYILINNTTSESIQNPSLILLSSKYNHSIPNISKQYKEYSIVQREISQFIPSNTITNQEEEYINKNRETHSKIEYYTLYRKYYKITQYSRVIIYTQPLCSIYSNQTLNPNSLEIPISQYIGSKESDITLHNLLSIGN